MPMLLAVLGLLACSAEVAEEAPTPDEPAAEEEAEAPAPKREGRKRKNTEEPAEEAGDPPASGGGGGGGSAKQADPQVLVRRAIEGSSMTVGQLPASCQPTAEGAPAGAPIKEWLARHQKGADEADATCTAGGAGQRCSVRLRRTKGREWMIQVDFELDASGALQSDTLQCVLAG